MTEIDVARAVVMHEGETLILQNADDDPAEYARGKWEVPGGFVEGHDDHERAAVRREVEEETGLDVEVVEELERVAVTIDGETTDCQYYLAHAEARGVELSDEHQAARWIDPADARDVDWYYHSLYMIPVLERFAGRD